MSERLHLLFPNHFVGANKMVLIGSGEERPIEEANCRFRSPTATIFVTPRKWS